MEPAQTSCRLPTGTLYLWVAMALLQRISEGCAHAVPFLQLQDISFSGWPCICVAAQVVVRQFNKTT
jgi:hypothetical protein